MPTINNNEFADFYDHNHCIRTIKWVPSKKWFGTNRDLLIGATSRAKPGEILNGDCYVVNHISSNKILAAVIDGLGHGREAHIASQLAKEQMVLKSDLPVDVLLNHTHNAIRGTRGAVVGMVLINTETRKLSFTGIGNIEGFIISANEKKNLLSFGGIVGHNMRTPRIFEFNFSPGDSLCMYSDGIISRWNYDDIKRTEHPQYNAEYLLNNFSRQNDDATVLIIRYNT